MDNKLFARNLRAVLESRGTSQIWLADKAGTTGATISRYLSEKCQPEITIVVRIAKALNVSVDYLCGLSESPVPKESLNMELKMLIKCYERADIHDKRVIWTILERHMTPREKEIQFSSSFTEAGAAKIG